MGEKGEKGEKSEKGEKGEKSEKSGKGKKSEKMKGGAPVGLNKIRLIRAIRGFLISFVRLCATPLFAFVVVFFYQSAVRWAMFLFMLPGALPQN